MCGGANTPRNPLPHPSGLWAWGWAWGPWDHGRAGTHGRTLSETDLGYTAPPLNHRPAPVDKPFRPIPLAVEAGVRYGGAGTAEYE